MRSLKIAFVVQGEGRGHMTQALALSAILRDAGHQLSAVLLGRSPHRPVPEYFAEGMGATVQEFEAPTQVAGPKREGLSIGRTLSDAVRRSPKFARAVGQIATATSDADVVVNLLDLLGGLSRRVRPKGPPALAIAHNFVFLHPALRQAPGPAYARAAVLAYARATAAGTARKVALSFDELPSVGQIGLDVAPPLLRPGLGDLEVVDDGFLLAYTLNAGYGAELARWQARHPEVEVHCFVEGGAGAFTGPTGSSFHAHDLDDVAFLARLARCRAYVGSAGFESVCEAHYLGKPVLAIPTGGQFEQTLNAWDAQRTGVARAGTYADLDDFWIGATPPSLTAVSDFQGWVARAPEILVAAVERTAHTSAS